MGKLKEELTEEEIGQLKSIDTTVGDLFSSLLDLEPSIRLLESYEQNLAALAGCKFAYRKLESMLKLIVQERDAALSALAQARLQNKN